MSTKQFLLGLLFLLFVFVANAVSEGADGPGVMLTRDKVERFLRQHVLQSAPWKPENVEVRIVSFQPVSLPPGQVNFRVVRPAQGHHSGRAILFAGGRYRWSRSNTFVGAG